MNLLQLLQRQPDHILVGRQASFLGEQDGQFRYTRLAIAMAPDQRRGRIQRVDAVPFPIVDYQFVAYFLN
jgi:hypothetical protein